MFPIFMVPRMPAHVLHRTHTPHHMPHMALHARHGVDALREGQKGGRISPAVAARADGRGENPGWAACGKQQPDGWGGMADGE